MRGIRDLVVHCDFGGYKIFFKFIPDFLAFGSEPKKGHEEEKKFFTFLAQLAPQSLRVTKSSVRP